MTRHAAVAPSQPLAERPPRLGRFVRVAGLRTHVLTKGQGRPVVLLHGNGSLGEEILSALPPVEGVLWIAPDRPGYGRSDPLPEGCFDPLSQAVWLDLLLSELGIARATLVAHSIAAGTALAFAAARAARIDRLVLLSPFCRPTPQRLMLGLRLASAPVVGRFVREYIVPPVARRLRKRIIAGFLRPNRSPPWLQGFPVTHAAQPRAIKSTAEELKAFNTAMRKIEGSLAVERPVTVIHGLADETADPSWHLPWLRRRTRHLRCILVRGCGHAVHHVAPRLVTRAILQDHRSASNGQLDRTSVVDAPGYPWTAQAAPTSRATL